MQMGPCLYDFQRHIPHTFYLVGYSLLDVR